jgi:hypothetical protein
MEDVRADRQREGLRILAKFAQVSDRKTVTPGSRCLRKCLFLVSTFTPLASVPTPVQMPVTTVVRSKAFPGRAADATAGE